MRRTAVLSAIYTPLNDDNFPVLRRNGNLVLANRLWQDRRSRYLKPKRLPAASVAL